jgi:hypothetical protein
MRSLKIAAALLMMVLLSACNDSTRLEDIKPHLPPLAATCIKAPLPSIVKGKPIPVFALENRRAAIMANLAVGNCQKFYDEVRDAYGQGRK